MSRGKVTLLACFYLFLTVDQRQCLPGSAPLISTKVAFSFKSQIQSVVDQKKLGTPYNGDFIFLVWSRRALVTNAVWGWHKSKHTDQEHKAEINLCLHGQHRCRDVPRFNHLKCPMWGQRHSECWETITVITFHNTFIPLNSNSVPTDQLPPFPPCSPWRL